jgi:hypothetical protein
MQKLNWLRDNRGQIKAYMYNGEFKMVVAWYDVATMTPFELVTETTDLQWWEKVVALDPRAGEIT